MKNTNNTLLGAKMLQAVCTLCGLSQHPGPCDHLASLQPLSGGDCTEHSSTGTRAIGQAVADLLRDISLDDTITHEYTSVTANLKGNR